MIDLDPNRELLIQAATALENLRDEVVFLGGAVVGLLITDAAAPTIRPTDDVDVVIEVASRHEYQGRVRDELRRLGFREDTRPRAPICRWVLDELQLDLMPTDERILGFSNRWYGAAMDHATRLLLSDALSIRLIAAPYFLATKLDAYDGRGQGDHMASHDLEDIIAVIDGRPTIVDEVAAAAQDARSYISHEIQRLLALPRFVTDALPGHLGGTGAAARLSKVEGRLKNIADLGAG